VRDRPNDQHRAIAERKLGRKLAKNEVVDHHDEDKANNNPNNLGPEDRGAHTARHNRQRGLSRLRASLRMFNEGKKLY
jgi:hypothetical protein